MRSHLIFQVVLRRFANNNGMVTTHNFKTGRARSESVYDVAYRDIDTIASANVLLIEKHR